MSDRSSESFIQATQIVRNACEGMGPTSLLPEAFFVARSGVLTLAYSGYTPAVLALKSRLEARQSLPVERAGSRWPKTTLAALHSGEPLTTDEIVLLKEATAVASTCLVRKARPLKVERMHLVELLDRAMVRIGRSESFELAGPHDGLGVDIRSRTSVNAVLSQWRREGLSRYVPDLFRPGFRIEHYLSPHHELSLVIRMEGRLPCLDVFRTAVEARLPRRYAWLPADGLHVTVRSLGDLDQFVSDGNGQNS